MIDMPAEPTAYHIEAAALDQTSSVEQVKERARSYLRARGLLEGAPSIANKGSLNALAVAMEQHCDLTPGSVIQVQGDTLSTDLGRLKNAGQDKFTCLMSVLWLSGVAKLNFVGGEIPNE